MISQNMHEKQKLDKEESRNRDAESEALVDEPDR